MGNFLDVRPNTSPLEMMGNNQLVQQVLLCRHLDVILTDGDFSMTKYFSVNLELAMFF